VLNPNVILTELHYIISEKHDCQNEYGRDTATKYKDAKAAFISSELSDKANNANQEHWHIKNSKQHAVHTWV
jgi:hypothetical protein